uniref:Uncharacterized protein n=1 Tax=Anguilla anguilla TaxID=7936 RepID=A0A0E9Q2R5_ANGAN
MQKGLERCWEDGGVYHGDCPKQIKCWA